MMHKISHFFKNTSKSIIIYNPISGVGHFDTWCALFVKALVNKGWKICVITPSYDQFTKNMQALSKGDVDDNVLVFDVLSAIAPDWKGRALKLIFEKIKKILPKQNKYFRLSLNDTLQAGKKTNALIKFGLRAMQFLKRKIQRSSSSVLYPKLIISAHNPLVFAADICTIMKLFKYKTSVTLNMYIDLYQDKPIVWKEFSKKMPIKWWAIHMDTSHTLLHQNFRFSNSLQGIFIISEDVVKAARNSIANVEYVWIPDITNIKLPETRSHVALQILTNAKNRKILFLGGAIGGNKNLAAWYELILHCNPCEWYFVQIGAIDLSTLSTKDTEYYEYMLEHPPENLFMIDKYLPDEEKFNEIINISDFIWGVYRNFDRSSNMLIKSSEFKKPIIVSDRFLMGKRVQEFEIGIAVDEDSIDSIKSGLEWLKNNPLPALNFLKYSKKFSTTMLEDVLDKSLISLKPTTN